ncbi:hypothetical protein GCM10010214_31710 [Streptomyces abikoensis]|nr:hypothetical protein GCM10010214_31710 [Streptomyces abikoensis]
MDGAVWGAIGATAGAALTALGGYLGPVRAARTEARLQAAALRERREAGAVERLIAIRSAYRDWDIYLFQTAGSYGGRGQSPQTVMDRVSELRKAALEASDAAMRDGWWIGSEYVPFEAASAQVLRLAAGEVAAYPSHELDDVRQARSALNERILERMAGLTEEVTVLRGRRE